MNTQNTKSVSALHCNDLWFGHCEPGCLAQTNFPQWLVKDYNNNIGVTHTDVDTHGGAEVAY